jgi:hypothetical protein
VAAGEAVTLNVFQRIQRVADDENRNFRQGLIVAILIHGFYNFLLFAAPHTNAFLATGTLPLLWLAFRDLKRKIKQATAQDSEAGRNRMT